MRASKLELRVQFNTPGFKAEEIGPCKNPEECLRSLTDALPIKKTQLLQVPRVKHPRQNLSLFLLKKTFLRAGWTMLCMTCVQKNTQSTSPV